MSVCKNIKNYTRRHERLADFFSLMAAVLFFGSIYLGFTYHEQSMAWIAQDYLLYIPIALSFLGLLENLWVKTRRSNSLGIRVNSLIQG